MHNDRLVLSPSVLTQEMSDGEIVLLHVTEGQYFTLNSTGSHIWQLLVSGQTLRGTAAALAEHYDIELADALLCVLKLTHELKRSGLLVPEAA